MCCLSYANNTSMKLSLFLNPLFQINRGSLRYMQVIKQSRVKKTKLFLETLRTRCNFLMKFSFVATGTFFLPLHSMAFPVFLVLSVGHLNPRKDHPGHHSFCLFSLFSSSWKLVSTYLSVWEGDDLLIYTKLGGKNKNQLIILSPLALPFMPWCYLNFKRGNCFHLK